ncbi:MAG: L-threonylcarbamoyladenylate synthase [bacterium]
MNKLLIELIKEGGVGVLGTDTIYGLVGSALLPATVERIYKIKERDTNKPLIILISSLADLKLFKVKADKKLLAQYWPGKVSIILPCPYKRFAYLHRGTNALAFRLPAKENLVRLLKKTGPLVAPSANPEGLEPAKTIKQAKEYFDDSIDFYLDEGKLTSLPSTLIAFSENNPIIKRKGAI